MVAQEDGKVLNAALPLLSPIVSDSKSEDFASPSRTRRLTPLTFTVTNGVYAHLFRFDYTKQPFLKRNVGFECVARVPLSADGS